MEMSSLKSSGTRGKFQIEGKRMPQAQDDEVAAVSLLSLDDVTSDNSPVAESDIIHQVMKVNRQLIEQIDLLRLRLAVDKKNTEQDKKHVTTASNKIVQEKEAEVRTLKKELRRKEGAVAELTQKNKNKNEEVLLLQSNIDDLKKYVEDSRVRAFDLHTELTALQNEKKQYGSSYDGDEEEISALQREIGELRKNLDLIENELVTAKKIISQQGVKIRLTEQEKKNMQVKFKEELHRLNASMRFEIEKMRDIMKKQWDEMKGMRDQNNAMIQDIREIKDLLKSKAAAENESPRRKTEDRVYNPGYLKGLNPTLPSLKKGSKRKPPGRLS